MNLIEILYKVVENPKSSENYASLVEYFNQNNMPQVADAFSHLLRIRYGTDNSHPAEQGERQS
jgi:hypothetical protein